VKKLKLTSEVEDLAGIRKERGVAKGLITRLINNIDNIPKNKEHVEKVKENISSLPEIVQRFEEAHQLYIASLKDDGAESFEQAIYTWIAGEEDEEEKVADTILVADEEDDFITNKPLIVPDMAALEEEYRKTAQALADIERARALEEEIYKMKLKAQMYNHQLQQEKYQNEVRLQKERQDDLVKQQCLEEELEQREIHTKTKGMGPTLDIPLTSTPGHADGERTIPVRSTPQRSSTRPSRLSWEPLNITSGESEQIMFVKTVIAGVVSEVLNESRVQQQSIVDSLQLPRRELQTFDGDSLRYWPFIRSFRAIVDTKNIDSASKLSCLMQYYKGNARRILNCCETMDPEDGYVPALKILEERYGNNYEISQKWIQRIINRPNLKGPSELRDFADDLKCCYQTLKNMGS